MDAGWSERSRGAEQASRLETAHVATAAPSRHVTRKAQTQPGPAADSALCRVYALDRISEKHSPAPLLAALLRTTSWRAQACSTSSPAHSRIRALFREGLLRVFLACFDTLRTFQWFQCNADPLFFR